jgi:hypothetical protein
MSWIRNTARVFWPLLVYVAHLPVVFLRDNWIRTQGAAVASMRDMGANLATHLPKNILHFFL